MRYREQKEEDLERAKTAVPEWRQQHPEGTAEQLVADLGAQFHPDYGPTPGPPSPCCGGGRGNAGAPRPPGGRR